MKKTIHIVISDTHSDSIALAEAITKAAALGAADIFSAGDLCPQGIELLTLVSTSPVEIIQVRGNCDSMYSYDGLGLRFPPMIISRNIEGGRSIEMTHGDRIWEPQALSSGDIFITGHTHVPHLYRDEEGIIHLNPGSISRPRNPEGATYAIIDEAGIRICLLRSDKVLKSLLFQTLKP